MTWEKRVHQLDVRSKSSLGKEYTQIVDGVDRHGALEWTFHHTSMDMDRYVTLAVVPEPLTDVALFEVRFSASNGALFVDRLLARGWTAGEYDRGDQIQELMAQAFEAAEQLTVKDLAEPYPITFGG
ncbi:MAG: hypothetical protein HOQ03_14385 [Thermoleophilia bacterium]|nr:hypothetical protein [Thermoleophilia bacterium]